MQNEIAKDRVGAFAPTRSLTILALPRPFAHIRKLKIAGVGVYFEKEDINTLDNKSEFLITLMSSPAEEQARSISENVKRGQRNRFADGKYSRLTSISAREIHSRYCE
ncbi:MAG: recombinase family protein [Oscillospiraceae bacterium]|nr:recombinase family protein [Oscillospiraceae bacterium]